MHFCFQNNNNQQTKKIDICKHDNGMITSSLIVNESKRGNILENILNG